MTDPELLHARLTSGDPGRVRQLAGELQVDAHDVDEAAERLTQGLARPVWDNSLARMAFLLRGQTSFVLAATASWRLTRGAQALGLAADGYDATADAADQAIGVWRRRPHDLLPFQESLLRLVVTTHLQLLAVQYTAVLQQAAALLGDADEDVEDWFKGGALRDYWFAVRTGAGRGPKIPDSLLNGDPGGWTVQGLAYDPASGSYLVSAYAHGAGGDASHLTVLDSHTGTELTHVSLTSPSGAHDVPAPQHSGGVAVSGDDVYVVSTQGDGSYLYHYSLAEIRGAGAGDAVPALDVSPVPASSYVSTAGGNLYLGDYGGSTLYEYPLSSVPALGSAHPPAPTQTYPTPGGSNGVVVLPGGRFVYAQNNTRDEPSQLITTDAQGTVLSQLELGNMVEEIELVDGQVVGLSESGSVLYSPGDDGTGDPADLWGQTNMFELPVGLVDGSGYAVQSQTLREAAHEFEGAVSRLGALAGRVDALSLDAGWLGEVDGAAGLATGFATFVHETADDVRSGAASAETTAHGLRDSARSYDDTDGAVAGALTGLFSGLGGGPG